MNDSPVRKKWPAWTLLLWLLPAAAVVYALTSRGGGGSGSKSGDDVVFDPTGVPELTLKGLIPDGSSSWTELTVSAAPGRDEKMVAHGKELFAKACAACHGDDGKGEGPLAVRLDLVPRPANFTIPIRSIKLRSTRAGTLPLDADLFRSITRGLPGTAMLSFRNFNETDRWALVQYVKEFWINDTRWAAAQPLEIVKKPPRNAELLEIGRREYTKWCQNCHGVDGTGGTSMAYQVERTYPAVRFARSHGTFLLRGPREEDLALTLLAGSSGTSPMMSFLPTFFENEAVGVGDKRLWGTVFYTRELIEARK